MTSLVASRHVSFELENCSRNSVVLLSLLVPLGLDRQGSHDAPSRGCGCSQALLAAFAASPETHFHACEIGHCVLHLTAFSHLG